MHSTRSIDACKLAGGRNDQVLAYPIGVFSDQTVMVFDAGSVAIVDACLKQQFVVEKGWHVKMDVHVANDQQYSAFLDLTVRDPRGAKHFDPTAFKVIQVLCMVDATLSVHLMVANSNGYLVLVVHGKNVLKSR